VPKRLLSGKVVSNKMDKTGVLATESVTAHRLYGKTLKKTKKYKFHDENNECQIGDLVEVEETKPYSKEKTWRLIRIIEKAED
jgi:small subunit ribosomal protein S17